MIIRRALVSRRAAGLAAGLVCALALSSSADVLVLEDGSSVDGKVLREADGFIWVKTLFGVEKLASRRSRSTSGCPRT
jgi:hypothetical protein